jgi:hypothetical protein
MHSSTYLMPDFNPSVVLYTKVDQLAGKMVAVFEQMVREAIA